MHLAALQYPYCRDDHAAGARVNVLGTVYVFDAAREAGAKLVYASSIAALAESLYGAWKRANEGSAAAYWAEDRFPSIGLRAAFVYGVGRDRGVTASMTLAMEAAARGETFHIVHGGTSPLNHAGDLARIFVRAARAVSKGAPAYDAGGQEHHMEDVVAAIEAAAPGARITFEDTLFRRRRRRSMAARSRRRSAPSNGGLSSRACATQSTSSGARACLGSPS